MKICYFGTYRKQYNRNRMMISSLQMNDVEVIECHETLWRGIEDRVSITKGGWKNPQFWFRAIRAYTKLLIKFLKVKNFDLLVVGYPGHFDIFLAWILSRFWRKPLVWDFLMSLYLVSMERGLDKDNQRTIKMIKNIEKTALKLPDLLIQDTNIYKQWLVNEYGMESHKIGLVPIGADDRVYSPVEIQESKDDYFIVLYYGTFIPNHGVLTILKAAKHLSDHSEILFQFIGTGPDLEVSKKYSQNNNLPNTEFVEWLEKPDLVRAISQADICLGAFSSTPQSLMTVQNKIYEAIAMKKPVINGESDAVRLAFEDRKEIYLCERLSGVSLANAIQDLYKNEDLRLIIAENGYTRFMEEYQLKVNGKRTKEYFETLIAMR